MWIDTSVVFSFFPLKHIRSLSPVSFTSSISCRPSGCPSFWPKHRLLPRDASQKTTWRSFLALPWPPGARESLNSAPLFSPGLGSHRESGAEKRLERLECGSGSRGRNVSSLFVSVCGAWWMRWVDVMTWLIAQTLNKSPILQQASSSGAPLCHCCQPTWADIVAGRVGGSTAPLSGDELRRGVGELGMTVKMAGADAPHLQCSWHLNGWGVFLGPVVGPRGSAGRPALMRSGGVRRCWWGQRGSSRFDEVSRTDASDGVGQNHNRVAPIMVLGTSSATCFIVLI